MHFWPYVKVLKTIKITIKKLGKCELFNYICITIKNLSIMATIKKLSFDMENIKAGEVVHSKRGNIYILAIRISGNMAYVNWCFFPVSKSYFSTDYRRSENIADFGIWHDLTTQQWDKPNCPVS